MTENAEQLSPVHEAAAFHGLATNPAVPPADRLAMALQALDLYEAEVERMREVSERPTPTSDSDWGFTVKRASGRWAVSLPHQCDRWDIAGESVGSTVDGVEWDEAVKEVESFVAAAQAALTALRERRTLEAAIWPE